MPDLDQIRIELQGIGFALRNSRLFVPKYQRSYAWKENHVTDLLKDITSAIIGNRKEYFLGSIVISYKDPAHPEVVDGQQRLATTLILLAAIRDYFFNNNDEKRVNEITGKYLVDTDLETLEMIPKLELNETDNNFYRNHILAPPSDPGRKIPASKDSHRRIEIAASIAAEHITGFAAMGQDPATRLVQMVKFIEESTRVIWVRVPNDANAFNIFETLNDRGLPLAISDLMKNYLFMLAGTRLDEVQHNWISMTSMLEAADNEEMVITFIRHLWSSKYGITRERELYQKVKDKITSKQAAISFAEELAEAARLYVAILNTAHEFWNDFGPTSRDHMETINDLGMIQIRPLLLSVLGRFDASDVKKSLKMFVAWSVRFLIHGGLGGGVIESNYCQRAVEVRNGTIKTARALLAAMKKTVPSDSEFESAFRTATVSKQFLARYYLRVLENQAIGQLEPEHIPNPNAEVITLEHILPLSPSAAWGHINPEIAEAYHSRIGNLALLKHKINSDIGNSGFLAKKPFFRDSRYKLTSSLARNDSWGIAEIEKRQDELAKLAVIAWPNAL